MQNFNGFWDANFEKASLKNISYNFKKGVLYGVTGKVGSGKSGLFSTILGDLPYYSGFLMINGKIAFTEQ